MRRKFFSCILLFSALSCTKSALNEEADLKHSSGENSAVQLFQSELFGSTLNGKSYSEVLDSVGKWPNDYQTFVLSAMLDSNFDITDTANLKLFIAERTGDFFIPKGLNPNSFPLDYCLSIHHFSV